MAARRSAPAKGTTKASKVDAIDSAAAALSKAEVKQLQFDPLLGKRAGDVGLKKLKPYRKELARDYKAFDLEELDELPVIADRLRAEQRKVQMASDAAGTLDSILSALGWRQQLLPIAQGLAKAGRIDQKRLDAIARGTGQTDNVQDVLDLVAVLTAHQAAVEGIAGPGSLASATTAANLALGKQGTTGEGDPHAAQRRDRYATLFVKRYDRLRVAYAAVTSFADALADLPGLRAGARAVKADEPTPP